MASTERSNGDKRRMRRRTRLALSLSCMVVVAGAVTLIVVVAVDQSGPRSSSPAQRPVTTTLELPSNRQLKIEQWTLIATLLGTTPSYATATSSEVVQTIPAQWLGAPEALPVIRVHKGRLEVRLLERPNGSTAWISSDAALLTRTQYHVVVDLAAERLLLFDHAKLVMNAPAGVGAAATPTPTGGFFVARLTNAPTPGYGSFLIITSAFSSGVTDWRQDGVAMVTINGPLGAETQIGSQGAAITSGSIRLLDTDLSRLRGLPLGVPIDVEAQLLSEPRLTAVIRRAEPWVRPAR